MHTHRKRDSFIHSFEMRWKCVNILWIVANYWTASGIYYGGRQTKHEKKPSENDLFVSLFWLSDFPYKCIQTRKRHFVGRILSMFLWVMHKIKHFCYRREIMEHFSTQTSCWKFSLNFPPFYFLLLLNRNFSMETWKLTWKNVHAAEILAVLFVCEWTDFWWVCASGRSSNTKIANREREREAE